jgi:hypothetical protein
LALPPSSRRDIALQQNRSDWCVLDDLARWLQDTLSDAPLTSMLPDGIAMTYRLSSGQRWVRLQNGTWVYAGAAGGAIRTTPVILKTDRIYDDSRALDANE